MPEDFTDKNFHVAELNSGQVDSFSLPDRETRRRLWDFLIETVENYLEHPENLPLSVKPDIESLQRRLEDWDFEIPAEPFGAFKASRDFLFNNQVHFTNPNYFGLFDPPSTFISILAETLVACFNPQLSVWSMAPAAVEIEQHLVRAFGKKFGYTEDSFEGNFTTGGSEANQTGVLAALVKTFPDFVNDGIRGLTAYPTVYVSVEGHHSIIKAVRLCGIGERFIRRIPVDKNFKIDIKSLTEKISSDKSAGFAPFLIIATAGTTNSGAIDSLPELKRIAESENLWLHTDAAWGGAAALVSEYRYLLSGIEFSDSIAFDPHKSLSMPRGTGMFLTKHRGILEKTFHVSTVYMPKDAATNSKPVNFFSQSIQWSRRFTSFKLFLALLIEGWKGYEEIIRHQLRTGEYLRQKLEESGWQVVNDSRLAVLCFVDQTHPGGNSPSYLEAVREMVLSSREAWISTTVLPPNQTVLRACVTNCRTGKKEADNLVRLLNKARKEVLSKN